jgi:hypothetical protein
MKVCTGLLTQGSGDLAMSEPLHEPRSLEALGTCPGWLECVALEVDP